MDDSKSAMDDSKNALDTTDQSSATPTTPFSSSSGKKRKLTQEEKDQLSQEREVKRMALQVLLHLILHLNFPNLVILARKGGKGRAETIGKGASSKVLLFS
jgi:hypothetical protein